MFAGAGSGLQNRWEARRSPVGSIPTALRHSWGRECASGRAVNPRARLRIRMGTSDPHVDDRGDADPDDPAQALPPLQAVPGNESLDLPDPGEVGVDGRHSLD